jgi:hypothetical protein
MSRLEISSRRPIEFAKISRPSPGAAYKNGYTKILQSKNALRSASMLAAQVGFEVGA